MTTRASDEAGGGAGRVQPDGHGTGQFSRDRISSDVVAAEAGPAGHESGHGPDCGDQGGDQSNGSPGPRQHTDDPEGEAGPPPRAGRRIDPGLYAVATPIGNLGDMTPRALDVLGQADLVLCEDTRTTGRLLGHWGVRAKLAPYHEHNAARMRPEVLRRLEAGERIALVSDAGTPLVSDPGYKLVREAAGAGHQVRAVPGASALTAALSIAGLPTDRVLFLGFPPAKPGERRSSFAGLAHEPATLVFYESPNRIARTLAELAELLGPRQAAVARELTKLYEEVVRGPLPELAARFEAAPPRGEIVLLIEGHRTPAREAAGEGDALPAGGALDAAAVEKLLPPLVKALGANRAARLLAELTGAPRKAFYARAVALTGDDDAEGEG
ncbi:uroporphyrin-III C/tetrapyrrole (corrin/porphyrin) methyltransferase [Tistrella mobilis KA081020-065]|uniref:Ribosomal RNA small subunit methyltransferase I n=1 Tax=Tistrella mobilis (strain KA081020-065) TaxID=1110502 RepID=I3TRB7_TISMK|nr:uroporphyrin-III C/tetrapyrrole (corrin/porphyrin) methyltransferase [Tistrella mobilis KA081020-065]